MINLFHLYPLNSTVTVLQYYSQQRALKFLNRRILVLVGNQLD